MSKTCKKLLASAIAATMLISTFVSSLVVSAAAIGTLEVGTATIEQSTTKAEVDLTFTYGAEVAAPHKYITLATDATFKLENVAVKSVNGNSNYGTEFDGEGEDKICTNPWPAYIEADGADFANGKFLIETKVDVPEKFTSIVLTATYTIPADAATGEYTVTADASATDYDEADYDALTATGKIVIEAAVVEPEHSAVADWSSNETHHWHACSVEGCEETFDYAEHSYGEWVVDTEATVDADGSKHRDCVCGKTETAVIPRILKFASASLTCESNIAINFKVKPEYFTSHGYTNPYVVFTMKGEDTTVSEYWVEKAGTTSERYVFTFSDIGPYLMTEEVSAVLYATNDGELYESAVQPYSVYTYCMNQLGKSNVISDTKLRTLLVDLLNYGTEAQKKWPDSNNGIYANKDLTEEQKSWATQTTPVCEDYLKTDYVTIDNAEARWNAAALTLQEAVVMRFRFDAEDITNLTVKVTTESGDEWTIPASEFEETTTSGRYYVYFDGLLAFQMRELTYVTLYRGETPVSNTLQYSIETYPARNSDASYTALLDTMMKYGDSAANYFS